MADDRRPAESSGPEADLENNLEATCKILLNLSKKLKEEPSISAKSALSIGMQDDLQKALADVLSILKTLEEDKKLVIRKASFFKKMLIPVLFTLRMPRRSFIIPLETTEIALECLQKVLEMSRGSVIVGTVFFELYIVLVDLIHRNNAREAPVQGPGTSFEERGVLACTCLHLLFRNLETMPLRIARSTRSILLSKNMFTPVGVGVSSLLTQAKTSHRNAKRLAYDTLFLLIESLFLAEDANREHCKNLNIESHEKDSELLSAGDILASYCPGIIEATTKTLLANANQGSAVFTSALKVWTYCIVNVAPDKVIAEETLYRDQPQTLTQASLQLRKILAFQKGKKDQKSNNSDEKVLEVKNSSSVSENNTEDNMTNKPISRNSMKWRASILRPLSKAVVHTFEALVPFQDSSSFSKTFWMQFSRTAYELLRHCSRGLLKHSETATPVVNLLVSTSVSPDKDLARVAHEYIEILRSNGNKTLIEAMEENLLLSIRALPRKLRGAIGRELSVINVVRGYVLGLAKKTENKPLEVKVEAPQISETNSIGLLLLSRFSSIIPPLLVSMELDLSDVYVVNKTKSLLSKTSRNKSKSASTKSDIRHTSGPLSYQFRFEYARSDGARNALLDIPRGLGRTCESGHILLLLDRILLGNFEGIGNNEASIISPISVVGGRLLESILFANQLVLGFGKGNGNDSELVARKLIMSHLRMLEASKEGIRARDSGSDGKVSTPSNHHSMFLSLIYHGIADAAEILGKSFQNHLIRSLFPLLEGAGGIDGIARAAARTSLHRIAIACGYSDVPGMIAANMDYVIDAASAQLRDLRDAGDTASAAPIASGLSALLETTQTSTTLLLSLSDSLNDLLTCLALVSNSSRAVEYLRVLSGIVQAFAKLNLSINPIEKVSLEKKMIKRKTVSSVISRLQRFMSEERKLRHIESLSLPEAEEIYEEEKDKTWASPGLSLSERQKLYDKEIKEKEKNVGKLHSMDQKLADRDEKKVDRDQDEEDKKATPSQEMVLRILKICRNFLGRREDLRLIQLSFKVFTNSLPVLHPAGSKTKNQLLPAVASAWPYLQPHFKFTKRQAVDPNSPPVPISIALLKSALHVLSSMGRHCPGFLTRRFSREIWPGLEQMLLRGGGWRDRLSGSSRARELVVEFLSALLEDSPKLVSGSLPGIVSALCTCIGEKAHEALRNLSVDALKAAIKLNADLVWWEVQERYQSYTKEAKAHPARRKLESASGSHSSFEATREAVKTVLKAIELEPEQSLGDDAYFLNLGTN